MKKVIWFVLKGLLYLTAFAVIASLTIVFLFIYVISALIAYAPASGTGYMIGYSDSSFKRWWWWRHMRDN